MSEINLDVDLDVDSGGVSAGSVITHASRLLVQAFNEAQRALQLVPAQYRVIHQLSRQENLTQKDLIKILDVEQSTIGNTLNRMEKEGLIERKPHPHDGRAQILCLTPRAVNLRDQAYENAKRVDEKAFSHFSDEERGQFFALMQKMIHALKSKSKSKS